jgi:hypothetical protein
MSNLSYGIIFIGLGAIILLVQMLIDVEKPAVPGFWTPKQQRTRMRIGGTVVIIYGLVEVIMGILK